jgi:hypothetical protein
MSTDDDPFTPDDVPTEPDAALERNALTQAWMDDGLSREEAVKRVQDPIFSALCLEAVGLEAVLNDDAATEGLRKALLAHDPHVLHGLYSYAKKHKPKGKPGPKPDRTGKYKMDVVASLRAQGKTEGQIAKAVYGDAQHGKRVSALLARHRKRQDRTTSGTSADRDSGQ